MSHLLTIAVTPVPFEMTVDDTYPILDKRYTLRFAPNCLPPPNCVQGVTATLRGEVLQAAQYDFYDLYPHSVQVHLQEFAEGMQPPFVFNNPNLMGRFNIVYAWPYNLYLQRSVLGDVPFWIIHAASGMQYIASPSIRRPVRGTATVRIDEFSLQIAYWDNSNCTDGHDGEPPGKGDGNGTEGISYDVQRTSQRHARAYQIPASGGGVKVGIATTVLGQQWEESDGQSAGIRPCVRWERSGTRPRLWIVVEHPVTHTISLLASNDEGRTFAVVTVATSGNWPCFCPTRQGLFYVYWRTAAGNIAGKILDTFGTVVQEEFTAVGGGDVADKAIACGDYLSAQGEWRIKLLFYRHSDGALTLRDSKDGKNFA